ncbi:MAG TPA: hypothetical protein PKD90_03975 [Phnomibacter sp.]|nr:hypothetical protein [Phnomibacter sp.]
MKKNTLTAALLALVIAAAPASPLFASRTKKENNTSAIANYSVNLKNMGTRDGYMWVEVSVRQPEAETVVLDILDNGGELLYSEKLKDASRSFIAKVDPSEVSNLVVRLKTSKGVTQKSYKVDVSTVSIYHLNEVGN